MQLVVVSAVRKAVSAATTIFTAISISRFFFIVHSSLVSVLDYSLSPLSPVLPPLSEPPLSPVLSPTEFLSNLISRSTAFTFSAIMSNLFYVGNELLIISRVSVFGLHFSSLPRKIFLASMGKSFLWLERLVLSSLSTGATAVQGERGGKLAWPSLSRSPQSPLHLYCNGKGTNNSKANQGFPRFILNLF